MFQRYLHLTGIPAYRTPDGGIFLDPLWERDLSRHTYFGSEVRVLCPMISVEAPPAGTVPSRLQNCEFRGLPHATNLPKYLLSGEWFRAIWRIWRNLAWPDVAFMGFVEHPIPYGWIAAPAARLRKVPWYTFIESSPWRVPPGVTPTWKHRLRAAVAERINGYLFRRAAFAFVSQPVYKEFLRPGCPHLVSPASWFLHDELATPAQIAEARAAAAGRPLHVMFMGRLDPGKGIDVLLQAIELLDVPGNDLTLTVMGGGQLRPRVEAAAAAAQHVRVVVGAPVPYGPEFFAVLRGADALLVPNLGDEQPRNVFDAFSQGVPVLVSDTSGLRSIVDDGVTGCLLPVGDAPALAAAIQAMAEPAERARWVVYGDAGYEVARGYDHDEMHAQRARFVAELPATLAGGTPRG